MKSDSSISDSKEECSIGISGSTTDEPASISKSEGLKQRKHVHKRTELTQYEASNEDDTPQISSRSLASTIADQMSITQHQLSTLTVAEGITESSEPTQPTTVTSKLGSEPPTVSHSGPISDSESDSDEVEYEPIPTGDLCRPHKTYESFLEETKKQKRECATESEDSINRHSSNSSHSDSATVGELDTSTSSDASGTADDLESDRLPKRDEERKEEKGQVEEREDVEQRGENPDESTGFKMPQLGLSDEDLGRGFSSESEVSYSACPGCGRPYAFARRSLPKLSKTLAFSDDDRSLDEQQGSTSRSFVQSCSSLEHGLAPDVATPDAVSLRSLTTSEEELTEAGPVASGNGFGSPDLVCKICGIPFDNKPKKISPKP